MRSTTVSRRATKSVLIGSTAIMFGLTLGGVAAAQDQGAAAKPAAAPQEVQEVVVTGSRIAKKDFTSNSPIVTVNSQSFQNSANVSVQSTLNKLPQFTPDQAQLGAQTGDVQPTSIHSPGIATASLRGLGSNRNLVLVDGRRQTPVDGLNEVDLNTIPSAMIDHVETISGGASAVYGADAMSGVVNFILKKNFQGLDLDARYGFDQHAGDGREFQASALFGTNFADDRGNVTFGVEHYTRSKVKALDRAFYLKGAQDPTTGSNALFSWTGMSYAPSAATGGCPSDAAYRGIFGNAPDAQRFLVGGPFNFLGDRDGLCVLNGAIAAAVQFNADGSLYSDGWTFGSGYGGWANTLYKGAVDGTTTAHQNVLNPFTFAPSTVLKRNATTEYPWLSSPLHRWSMFSNAHFDINDNITAFAVGNFSSSETYTDLLPTTPINGWGALVPYNQAIDDPSSPTYNPAIGHPVPQGLATLLNSRLGQFGTGTFLTPAQLAQFANHPEFNEAGGGIGTSALNTPWALNLIPDPNTTWLPPRATDVRITNWQITGGVDFKVPHTDWTGEIYGSHGETLNYQLGTGNVDLGRWQTIITAPNYGKNLHAFGNQYPLIGGGFGAGQVNCTSGLYDALFFNQRPSQDCINSLLVNLQSTNIVQQNVVEFDTQGSLFALPAGEVKGSLGADYRENRLTFRPDTLQDTNNFYDQVSGLYPTQGFDASVQAREGYGELSIPLIANAPFIKYLELNPGVRYSTYTNSESGWTYKIQADWEVNDWARLRGGYNLAVRAPSVAESYLALQEVYGGGSSYGDPCSLTTNAPYGAKGAIPGPGQPTTAGYVPPTTLNRSAQSAYEICLAQMGAQGSQAYYNGQTSQPNTSNTGALWVDQIGNPNLKPEKAHTWTAGVVLKSPVTSPWLDRTQLSVDWYKIKISGVIGFESSDAVNQRCYSQDVLDSGGNVDPTKVAAALASIDCQRSLRSTATGNYAISEVSYLNLGKIETSGFDVQLNWGVAPADVGVSSIPGSFNVNVLFNYLSHMTTNTGLKNAWDIDWAGTLGPTFAGVNAGAYRWKLYSTFTYMVGPASISLAWQHLPGVKPASYYTAASTTVDHPTGPQSTTNTTMNIGSYNRFDLSATYAITPRYNIRAGVDNLLDADPVTTGATYDPASLPASFTGSRNYVASSGAGTTNPLFYDVLGRRFYVGVSARF
jgi:outer membrane receptor protein involved in Fe transport